MSEPSIAVLIALGIQLFALSSLLLNRCAPIERSRRPFFKWFLLVLFFKILFQTSIGTTLTFTGLNEDTCKALEPMYAYSLFNIDLAISAVLSLIAYPPVRDKTTFCVVNQLSFIMIISLAAQVGHDGMIFVLMAMSVCVACISLFCCLIELVIVFLLYAVSFVLAAWLGGSVMLVFQAVYWVGVLGWFTVDKRNTSEVAYAAPPTVFETIEMN